MNEIQTITAQSDLEILKSFVPQWKQSVPEPFLTSAQQDVVMPTWNKLDMGQNIFDQGGSSGGPGTTIRCITILNGLATYIQAVATPDGIVV